MGNTFSYSKQTNGLFRIKTLNMLGDHACSMEFSLNGELNELYKTIEYNIIAQTKDDIIPHLRRLMTLSKISNDANLSDVVSNMIIKINSIPEGSSVWRVLFEDKDGKEFLENDVLFEQ